MQLIQIIRDDTETNQRIIQLLKLDSFQRRRVLNLWLEQLHRNNAPLKLTQTLASFFDDSIAEKVLSFVNDIKATFPADVGIAIYSLAFMTDSRILGEKQETFFIPFEWQSANFQTALKKVVFKPTCFVSEIKIEQEEIGE